MAARGKRGGCSVPPQMGISAGSGKTRSLRMVFPGLPAKGCLFAQRSFRQQNQLPPGLTVISTLALKRSG